MKYTVSKVPNCFSESETYEYAIPVTGEAFLRLLCGWEIRENRKLRRPVGIAEQDGIVIKTVLAGQILRISYPRENWQEEKEKMEAFLENCL